MKIKWTNKYSGEEGFVKSINRKERRFENTFDSDKAKLYSEKTVQKTIVLLESFCSDNTYQAV